MSELHLRCNRCEDRVGVARVDSETLLVCHCTHVDGEIDPRPLDTPLSRPARWYWV